MSFLQEDECEKRRDTGLPKRIYIEPKYPDEPLHIGAVSLIFIIVILLCVVMYKIYKF